MRHFQLVNPSAVELICCSAVSAVLFDLLVELSDQPCLHRQVESMKFEECLICRMIDWFDLSSLSLDLGTGASVQLRSGEMKTKKSINTQSLYLRGRGRNRKDVHLICMLQYDCITVLGKHSNNKLGRFTSTRTVFVFCYQYFE